MVREASFSLIIHSTGGQPVGDDDRPLGEHNTDGLLVFTDSLTDQALRQLHAQQFPMVLLRAHRQTTRVR